MPTNKKRSWKWFIIVAAVLLVGTGISWWLYRRSQGATQYQTAPVARREIIQSVTATGQLNPVTNVTVGSQISGIIQTLYVDFNSSVKKGQLVAEIDPSTYRAIVQQTEGDLANAKATHDLAQVNAKRSKELFDAKLIADSDYDTAMATLHQTEATVLMKEASLSMAKVNLSYCSIYSPVSGTVISRSVDVGQTVAASLSAPTLFVIAADLTKMQIDANVAEADIGTIAEGQTVDFTVDAFPGRLFHGKVTQVRNAPITVQNVVTYDTVISVDNSDLKLKPGMTSNISIIIEQRDNVLQIPNAALRFRPPELTTNTTMQAVVPGAGGLRTRLKGERRTDRTIYIFKGNKLLPGKIKIGISDGVYTEVLGNELQEGDSVVTAILKQGRETATSNNPFSGGTRLH